MIECLACGRNTPYDVMELEGLYIYIYACIRLLVKVWEINEILWEIFLPFIFFLRYGLTFRCNIRSVYFCKYVLYK